MKYVSERITNSKHAGSKARNDVEDILAHTIVDKLSCVFDNTGKRSIVEKIRRDLGFRRLGREIKKQRDEILFIQYPIDRRWYTALFESIEKAAKRNKIVLIIHDVDFIRERLGGKQKDREVKLLNSASVLICHNRFMEAELKANGVVKPAFICLGIFDYLVDELPDVKRSVSKKVAYAGNLAKAPFLKELANVKLGWQLVLYGLNYTETDNPEIEYRGALTPEELVSKIDGSFGLVWDSETIDGCTGKIGEYTRFNNPHKLSLYIVSGMPVIVWAESAVAEFVQKNGIGFAVNSLKEIPDRLSSLTNDEYEEYLHNVALLQRKISNGEFMKTAIRQAIELCEGRSL